jgi:ssRNA-specific RNase YbeY (16S rRNA maturation enzyme)
MLHCIGFDDHDEEAHLKMHEEEDRILTAIGVGPIWSSGS